MRDLLIDNVSRHASIISKVNGRFSPSSSGEYPFVVLSRRYLGAFVNGLSQQIEFDSYDKASYDLQKDPAGFIDLSALTIDISSLASIAFALKFEFNEMLMGRVILIPCSCQTLFSELSSAGFHASISFRLISPELLFCNDIIGIKLLPLK